MEFHDLIVAEDSEIVRNLLVRLAVSRGFKPVAEERGDDAMRRVHDGVKAVIIDLKSRAGTASSVWSGWQGNIRICRPWC